MRRRDTTPATTLAILFGLFALPLAAGAAEQLGFDRVPALFEAAHPGCTANDQCGADEFCAHLYGECGVRGACETRPKECLEHGHPIVKPMCGCDGKTYDNACLAAVAGTSIDHEGTCPAP